MAQQNTSKINRNTKSGIILSFLIALVPVLLWSFGHPPTSNFTSTQTSLDGLAKLLGIVGASLYAWNLILSARISWLERQFGGLDRLYKVHHCIGGLAFIAILFHPLLLAIKYATISLISAYSFIMPDIYNLPLLAGKIALGGLVAVLFITFYIYVAHEKFVWIHRLTGVLFMIALYHFLYVSQSDVRQIPLLYTYMLVLSLVAVGLYSYRSLFGQSIKPRFRYQISEIHDLGGAWDIALKPIGKYPLKFTPGQFSFVTFINAAVPEQTHPFSISGGESGALRYTIKNLGDFTSQLGALRVGDKAYIEGPYGSFSYTNMLRKKQIWIAGGIGITPFLAMARSLKQLDDVSVEFYYSVTNKAQAYFADELVMISKDLQQKVSFTLHDSSKAGFLTAENIIAAQPGIKDYEILLCGPGGMMKALELQFVQAGVSKAQIHYEEFSLL